MASYIQTLCVHNAPVALGDLEQDGVWLIAVGAFLVAASFLWQGSVGGLGGRPVGPGGTRADRVVYAVGLAGALLVAVGSVIAAVKAFPDLWVVIASAAAVVVAVWVFGAWRLRVDSRKNRDSARGAADNYATSPLAPGWEWEARRYEWEMAWRRCLRRPFTSETAARQRAEQRLGPCPVPEGSREE